MNNIYRQFEIPYNFDKNLINGLQILNIIPNQINCFYMPPFPEDYIGIIRRYDIIEPLYKLNRQEYESHINYINKVYPNKLQLLLQQTDEKSAINFENKLSYYINLGFNNFCVGSIKQAEIIKKHLPNANIIGSITMNINNEKLNNSIYMQYFNGFVLNFQFSRQLNNIKKLPKNFYYILLINAQCYNKCNGTFHWQAKYEDNFNCPYLEERQKFMTNCLIRPMDLFIFDPYISVYKLGDRGAPTFIILHDLILYNTNKYNIYPNIVYSEDIYNTSINT